MDHPLTPTSGGFDAAAPDYDRSFSTGTLARLQRSAVREHLETVLKPGMRVLELGCGTGDDALWLARRGLEVVATDASGGMLSETRRKVRESGLADRVTVCHLDLNQIEEVRPGLGGTVDAAFANFGPLNCLPDRRPVGRALARLMPATGPLVIVMLGTLCPWEIAWYLVHGAPRTALRRFREGAPAAVGGGGTVPVWYPRPRRLRRELRPWFELDTIAGLGVLLPPPALEHLARGAPHLVARLVRLERHLARRWPYNRLGDHTMLTFRRVGSEE